MKKVRGKHSLKGKIIWNSFLAMFRYGKPHGSPTGGLPFDDAIDLKLPLMTPCIGVDVFWYPDYLFALRFIYRGENSSSSKGYHGDPTSRDPPLSNKTFMMNVGERINKVTWYVGTHLWQYAGNLFPFVLGIQFFTSRGRTSQLFGSIEGEKYSESYEGFTLGYAKGRSVTLIDQLQIVWINQGMYI